MLKLTDAWMWEAYDILAHDTLGFAGFQGFSSIFLTEKQKSVLVQFNKTILLLWMLTK